MNHIAYRPLPTVAPGQRVQVMAIAAGQRATHRLQAMGLVPGADIQVIQSQGNGALIIAVGDSRLAVERGIAHKVLVQPLAAPASAARGTPTALDGLDEAEVGA